MEKELPSESLDSAHALEVLGNWLVEHADFTHEDIQSQAFEHPIACEMPHGPRTECCRICGVCAAYHTAAFAHARRGQLRHVPSYAEAVSRLLTGLRAFDKAHVAFREVHRAEREELERRAREERGEDVATAPDRTADLANALRVRLEDVQRSLRNSARVGDSPVPVGRPAQLLLRNVEGVLYNHGFSAAEIVVFGFDGKDANATERLRERLKNRVRIDFSE